jgi:hypothetical protein
MRKPVGAHIDEEEKGEQQRWPWEKLDDGKEGSAEPLGTGKGVPSSRT